MLLDAAVQTLDSGVRKYHAVEFATVEGFRPLQLDLYLPPTGVPVVGGVVYLHGGGWRVGTRRRFGRALAGWNPTALDLVAQAGLTIATVDYRLSSEAQFPAMLHDSKAAVRWLRARAGDFGFPADRVSTWGESAGGHLALLLALTAGRAELDGAVGSDLTESSAVWRAAAWYPPCDLTTISADRRLRQADDDDTVSPEALMVGAPLSNAPDVAWFASPAAYVHADAPPIQIHHGNEDDLVPYEQSVQLVESLRRVGAPGELKTVEGSNHFWTGAADLRAIFDTTLAFVLG